MNRIIESILSDLKVGEETTCRNLTMFPLLNGEAGEPDYLLLDEALAQGRVRVTEISEGGSVPEIRLTNEADRPVLLLDGEELVGAKQNRVLNLTILAPAGKTIVIPVSCVEAGRWHRSSADFFSSPQVHYSAGRARKMASVSESLLHEGRRSSDQAEVWADIAEKAERMRSSSPTEAMSAIFEHHTSRIGEYAKAFSAREGQIGALFAINGEVVGLDLFDSAATLRKFLPKLVRSYALDAIDAETERAGAHSKKEAGIFLKAVAGAEVQSFPAVGEGEDLRLSGEHLAGGALAARGRVVHLCAFRLEEKGRRPQEDRTLSRPLARRRRWQRARFDDLED